MIDPSQHYVFDTIELLKQVLLGGLDVARVGIQSYKKLIIWSAKRTVLALALGVGLMVLGNFANVNWIGAIGLAILGLLAVLWLLILSPIIAIVDSPTEPWQALARIARLVFSLIVVTGLMCAILLNLPGGFSVAAVMTFTPIVFGVSMAFGLSMTRQFLVVMLVLFDGAALVATVAPETAQALMVKFQRSDSALAESIHGKEQELPMDVAALRGIGSQPVQLYDKAGKSLWWCRETSDSPSGIRCFSRAGIDPATATERFALTAERGNRAAEKLQLEEERLKKLNERVRAEREEAERIATRDRLVNLPPTPLPVLLAIEEGSRFNPAITGLIAAELGIQADATFLPAAYQTGMVSRIRVGDPKSVRDLNLDQAARTLVLGSVVQGFVPNETLPNAGRAEIQLEIVAIDARSAQTLWRERIDVSELGHNQRLAADLAQNALTKRVQAALRPLLQSRVTETR